MSIIEKTSPAELTAVTRISESDKKFCEAHQASYEAAIKDLHKLRQFWISIIQTQNHFLEPVEGSQPNNYLTGGRYLNISDWEISKQIHQTHIMLISKIVNYFTSVYCISISLSNVTDALLPKCPRDSWSYARDQKLEEYEQKMDTLKLNYAQIIEQIFIQTDGKDLLKQAEIELKKHCREGAVVDGCLRYSIQKQTLQFFDGISHKSARSGTEDMLRGLAHFETGKTGDIPSDFPNLCSYNLPFATFDCNSCQKVKKLRLYKNGRLDIRFTEEAYAVQFAKEYLGMVGGAV